MDNKPVEGQQLDLENAIIEYLETGSQVSREKIIALGQTIAGIFADLYSSGSADSIMKGAAATGFLKALKNYGPQGKGQFSTYAALCIISEIRKELKKRELFKVPGWLIQLQEDVNKATEELAEEKQMIPTLQEIADKINNAESAVKKAMMAETEAPDEMNAEPIKALRHEAFIRPVEDVIMIRKALDRLGDIKQKVLTLFSTNLEELRLAIEEEQKALGREQKGYREILKNNGDTIDYMDTGSLNLKFPTYFAAHHVKRYYEILAEEYGLRLINIKYLNAEPESVIPDYTEKESDRFCKPKKISLYLEGRYRGLLYFLDYLRCEKQSLQVEKVRTTRNETIPARVSIFIVVEAIFKEFPAKEQLIREPVNNE